MRSWSWSCLGLHLGLRLGLGLGLGLVLGLGLGLGLGLASSPPPPLYIPVEYRGQRCKKSRNLFSISLFFQHKIHNFFSKTYLTKSVRNVKIAFLYMIKHVKILIYKVTKLHFMYDVYICIYIQGGGQKTKTEKSQGSRHLGVHCKKLNLVDRGCKGGLLGQCAL